jgi:AP-3 complex subunit beta
VYPVKLSPEVGALVRPLPLSMDAFTSAELSISGMHESSRRCYLRNILSEPLQSSNTAGQTGEDKAFVISRKIAAQVLSIAYVDIVSVTLPIASSSVVQFGGQTDLTGLKLRFCGETLTGSVTCLISVTVMAKTENDSDTNDLPVLIKVNCEDTIFGLNLLRKLHQDLSS